MGPVLRGSRFASRRTDSRLRIRLDIACRYRNRFACRRGLCGGQCAECERRRSAIRDRRAPRARVARSRSGGGAIIRAGSNFAWTEVGEAQMRSGASALCRGAGNIICGCHAARKSARPDAAGARYPRQRGRDRGRGHAGDRRAAASFRDRDAPDLAPRAQRGRARRADRAASCAQDAAWRWSAMPGRRRSAIPARASCARCARRGSGGADSGRERRDRRGVRRRARCRALLFLGFLPAAPRRGASCSPRRAAALRARDLRGAASRSRDRRRARRRRWAASARW